MFFYAEFDTKATLRERFVAAAAPVGTLPNGEPDVAEVRPHKAGRAGAMSLAFHAGPVIPAPPLEGYRVGIVAAGWTKPTEEQVNVLWAVSEWCANAMLAGMADDEIEDGILERFQWFTDSDAEIVDTFLKLTLQPKG